ncbi:MAG TPA: hypothetical protein VKE88_00390 [Candidatus Nanoarchaeia archaeon]|nr:hypothetical protein [Candidatus Nanoarchaeia archaeon]
MWLLSTLTGKYEALHKQFSDVAKHYNHSKDLIEVSSTLEAPFMSLTTMGVYGGDQVSINKHLEATLQRLMELKVHLLGAVTYLHETQDLDIAPLHVVCDRRLDEIIALLSKVISYSRQTSLTPAMTRSIQNQFKKLLLSFAESLHTLAKYLIEDIKKQKPVRRLIDHFNGEFEFHTGGPFAAYDVLRSRRPSDRLTKGQVKKAQQLLDAYGHHVKDVARISETGLWIDLGRKHDPIRILIDREHPKHVYYIIPLSEHRVYENQLNKRPPVFHSVH